MSTLVRLSGHDSVSAYSGEEALSIASDFRPDVLVTDYSMPGMNGFQLATCIAQQYPGCRLFLLTADLDVSRFLPTPCRPNVTVLQKPLPPNDLLAAIAHPEIKLQPNSPVLLTVDDVEAHRYSVSRLFTHAGFIVIEAKNGEETLDRLASRPDAVLLDLHLPDIDGFEICRRIRASMANGHVPIVHFTATYRNDEAAQRSRAAGADDYIEQPIDPDSLVRRVRNLIQKRYFDSAELS